MGIMLSCQILGVASDALKSWGWWWGQIQLIWHVWFDINKPKYLLLIKEKQLVMIPSDWNKQSDHHKWCFTLDITEDYIGFYQINQQFLSYFPVKYINIIVRRYYTLFLENVKYYYRLIFINIIMISEYHVTLETAVMMLKIQLWSHK